MLQVPRIHMYYALFAKPCNGKEQDRCQEESMENQQSKCVHKMGVDEKQYHNVPIRPNNTGFGAKVYLEAFG
jgi:hypothetical protein